MSFFEQTSAMKQMVATVLIPGYQIRGNLQVLGMIQTFMNDESKGVFTIKDAQVFGLEPHNPAASMQIEEMHIRRDQVLALAFDQELSHEETGLLPRTEQIAAYTSHYVIQGGFHLGTDDLVSDFVTSSRAPFLGATSSTVFPLFQPRAAIIQQAPLIYIHAKTIRMYHQV